MPKKLSELPPFEEMNHTELWQMAKRVGIWGASAAAPREALVEALQKLEHIDMVEPLNLYRQRFSQWLRDNWDRLQMQMPTEHCPNCHLSSDMEMANCWLDNHHRVA